MWLNANQIQYVCSGKALSAVSENRIFAKDVKIDSRKVKQGDLFIAFVGINDDGNKYIPNAILSHATVVLCEKKPAKDVLALANSNNVRIILVNNSKVALQKISKVWRDMIDAKVIGITGSVGKTTTKNFSNAVLSGKYKVTATQGNLNNDIGLPMTVCRADEEDNFLITEMGMNGPGQIAEICKFALPDVGIITNIGTSHIEFFKSQDGIAKAKSELALALPKNSGILLLYENDKYRDYIIKYANVYKNNIQLILFGGTKYNSNFDCPQVWFEGITQDENAKPSFYIDHAGFDTHEDKCLCNINMPGAHNAINACAAAALGILFDIGLQECVKSLESCSPESGRSEVLTSKVGYKIINDAYNANPDSMKMSLYSFNSMKTEGKKIAVLGDMLELGSISEEAHKNIGKLVSELKIDYLICVGKQSKNIFDEAIHFGMNENNVFYTDNAANVIDKLNTFVNKDDLVLFKASNSMGFQKLVKDLI